MTKLRKQDLIAQLRKNPRAGGAELCSRLGGINRATLSRAMKALKPFVVSAGGSRRMRYALRRELRGDGSEIPLFRIDENGHGHEVGHLSLTYPEGSHLNYSTPPLWPLDRDMQDGWFESLPYFLYDIRPQGFLGRNFAHSHTLDLGVPEYPEAWSDDDITYVLSRFGHDQPGNLILGEISYRKFLDMVSSGGKRFLSDSEIETYYVDAAENAMRHGDAGSSAGGEFPKFTCSRESNDCRYDVIVKFSGADDSPAVRRWSDLLICEHLALQSMQDLLEIEIAHSKIFQFGGRTFLEVERFDRHGEFGRSPTCTLSSINTALIGEAGAPWPFIAQKLNQVAWLAESEVQKISLTWWFGKLIGNSDMHEGNLAFRPGLKLAPIYDMLPMAYAPQRGGELPIREFKPELPLPSEKNVWSTAVKAAGNFWSRAAAEKSISDQFRNICIKNRDILTTYL